MLPNAQSGFLGVPGWVCQVGLPINPDDHHKGSSSLCVGVGEANSNNCLRSQTIEGETVKLMKTM